MGVFFQKDVDLGVDEINFGTESEASIVLDNTGIADCPQSHTKCSDVIGCFHEYDAVPRTQGADGGCGMSRACQFLPLLFAMKATEMAN